MKKNCLIIILCLSTCLCANAQISNVTLLTKNPRLYERTDWTIELTGIWENPYLQQDVALDMLLTAPSGKKMMLPCYYESGTSGSLSVWKARFAPQEKGTYQYSFQFSKMGQPAGASKNGHFSVKSSDKDGILHIKNNWVFQYDNGKPFRGVGENICWESRAHDDSKFFRELHEKPKYNYEEMLPKLAAHGGNYFRTWISSFNLPIDWKSGFNSNRYTATTEYYNPSAIAKMDRLIELCDSLHLHIMLTLGQGASSVRDGGFATSNADFFVNPQAKKRYKNRLRYFVARWGYSPAIGAWEFFNEVDNVQFSNRSNPIAADSIVQWHDEMSAYLKELDPYDHPITTSISHRDLKGLNSLAAMDFNQKHIYKNTTGMPAAIVQYERVFNKPYVIGEFSYEWDWSKDFNQFSDGMDSDFKRGLWYGLFTSTPVLPMSWWWEYFDDRGTDAYLSKVRTISDQMLKAGNGSFDSMQVVVTDTGLQHYSVKCGRQAYIYLYNVSGAARQTVVDISQLSAIAKASIYDCETGTYSNVSSMKKEENGVQITSVNVPEKSDIIVILDVK